MTNKQQQFKDNKQRKQAEQQLFRTVILEIGRTEVTLTFEMVKPLYDKWAIADNIAPLTQSKYNQLIDIAWLLV